MLILECPNCHDCHTAEEWNKSPHIGEEIPETTEDPSDFDEWNMRTGGGQFDCPSCGDVAITEDMIPV